MITYDYISEFLENGNDFPIFENPATLLERRKSNRIYLPEDPVFDELDVSDEELLAIFSGVSALKEEKIPFEADITSTPKKILGREVGDDRIDLSNDPVKLAIALNVQETVLGMKTSQEDTGISADLWNFCEVSTGLPSSKSTMYNFARKNNNFKHLDFVDSPPIRVVIDSTKMDRIHSTSYMGKVKILGAKLRSTNQVCNGYLEVANLFQDAMLAVWRGPDPKYLPSIMGGCNCPDSYQDPYNTYLFMKAFKGGGYDRIYGTAVEEAKQAIALNESGTPTCAFVSEILRDNDSYCFATFANMVALPDKARIIPPMAGDLPLPLYWRAGVRNEVVAVEARLVAAKRLINRPQAEVEWARKNRIHDYIFSSTDILENERYAKDQSAFRRKELGSALSGNTAFMHLVNRTGSKSDITQLFQENWKPCVSGQEEFKYEHALWLSKGAKGKTLNIFDIPSSSDMFIREEVSVEESFKIGGIDLLVAGKTKWIPQTTITKVGLYEINQTMEDWSDEKISSLKSLRDAKGSPLERYELISEFLKNREWVNDDTLLIEKCIVDTEGLNKPQVCLISKDKRLCNQMSIQANCEVILVDPRCLPRVFPDKQWNQHSELTAREVFDKYPTNGKFRPGRLTLPLGVYLDTGSLASCLSNMEVENVHGVTRLYTYEPISNGTDESGHRYDEFKKSELFFESKLDVRIFDPDKKRPGKKKRTPLSRDSSSSSRFDWSTDTTVTSRDRVTRRAVKF